MPGEPQTLTSEAAFAFATTWRDQLFGCVKLYADSSPPSLFTTAEWVSFFNLSGSGDVVSKYGYARATTIVWFALPCCKSFSGTENPQFWQQIFNSAFHEPTPLPVARHLARGGRNAERLPRAALVTTPALDKPVATPLVGDGQTEQNRQNDERRARRGLITEAGTRLRLARSTMGRPERGVRFFPSELKAPFPRVKLQFRGQPGSEGIRTFLGLLPSPVEMVDAEVRTILEQLAPFIRETHWQRRVDVAVDTNEESPIASVLTELLATESEPAVDLTATFSTPKFQITTIGGGWSWSPEDLAVLDAELPLCGVEVTRTPALGDIVQDGQLIRAFLRRVPRQRQRNVGHGQLPRWRISRVRFMIGFSKKISALCSALPHIPSVQSLEVRCEKSTPSSLSDWAWLGYAFFHPDAARHSALTSIGIGLIGAFVEDLDAFESMARSNNLSPEGETQATSDQYVEGFIEAPTAVWTLSGGDPTRSTLQSYLSTTWVTVCVSTIDEAVGKEWLCIVNPGIGFGHIRESGVSEWRSRPPGQPSIRSLRIHVIRSSEAVTVGVPGARGCQDRPPLVACLLEVVGYWTKLA